MSVAPYEAVVMGGSSGGIEALNAVLPALPPALHAAVIVVMHMPRDPHSRLREIFQPRCALPVREAQDKEPIEPGTVYFAPPDYHLLLDHGPRIALSVDPPVLYSRPSIDVLFESAADLYGERLLGIVLSGANEDGARGAEAIQAGGGGLIVQEPSSARVSTMPLATMARVTADHVLPPDGIAALLCGLHEQGRL